MMDRITKNVLHVYVLRATNRSMQFKFHNAILDDHGHIFFEKYKVTTILQKRTCHDYGEDNDYTYIMRPWINSIDVR